jgi:hypothetical protein
MSTTRISDLPENITLSMQPMNPPGMGAMGGGYQTSVPPQLNSMNTRQPPADDLNLTYSQMNVHPNPYGNPQQPQVMPIPQAQFQHQQQMPQQPQYRLPSRDIPLETDMYTQDESITPNYIPPVPKLTGDYIRDYEDDDEIQLKNHKQKKHKEKLMDRLFTELQIPIFIAIVFFVFQMPIVNTMIFKRFSFLSIYSADGNFNFYGLFLKSLAFGFAYFALTKTIDYISDI